MQLLCYQSDRSKLFKVLTHSIGSCTLTGSLFQEHNCFNLLGDELPMDIHTFNKHSCTSWQDQNKFSKPKVGVFLARNTH